MVWRFFTASSPQAAAILSAAAIAAENNQDLQGVFARLAKSDPSLGSSLSALQKGLATGEPLSQILRNERIITRKEYHLLRLAETWGVAARFLPIFADERLRRPVSMTFHDHLPFWVTGSILFGGIWVYQILMLFTGDPIGEIYRDLAIVIPPMTQLAFGSFLAAASFSLGLLLAVSLVAYLVRLNPDWPMMRAFCCLSVERPRLRRELLYTALLAEAAREAGGEFPRSMWSPLWRAYMVAMHLGRQVTGLQSAALRNCDRSDLVGRMQVMGLLAAGNQPCQRDHVHGMIRASGQEQFAAYERLRPLLFIIFLILIFGSFVSALFLPLMRIVAWIA